MNIERNALLLSMAILIGLAVTTVLCRMRIRRVHETVVAGYESGEMLLRTLPADDPHTSDWMEIDQMTTEQTRWARFIADVAILQGAFFLFGLVVGYQLLEYVSMRLTILSLLLSGFTSVAVVVGHRLLSKAPITGIRGRGRPID